MTTYFHGMETKRLRLLPVSVQYRQQINETFTPEVTWHMRYTPSGEMSETDARPACGTCRSGIGQ